jgi:RHS repeat-associated protein
MTSTAVPWRRITARSGTTSTMANTAWGKLLRESEMQGSGYSQNERMQGNTCIVRELHDNLFRYYDLDCGRFTHQDPMGWRG